MKNILCNSESRRDHTKFQITNNFSISKQIIFTQSKFSVNIESSKYTLLKI